MASRYTRIRDIAREDQFKILFMASIFLKSVKFAQVLAESIMKSELLKSYSKYFWSEGSSVDFAPRMLSMVSKMIKYLPAKAGKIFVIGMAGEKYTLSEIGENGKSD